MGDILVDNKKLYNFELKFLTGLKIVNYSYLLLFIIGIFQTKPTFLLVFNTVFKIILALFLIYRFNNYRKQPIQFTELDRKICYSTGIFIILISFIDIITYNIEYIRNNFILPHTQPIINYFKTIPENLN
jgi:magnesium-transporting ATPase (P-type)